MAGGLTGQYNDTYLTTGADGLDVILTAGNGVAGDGSTPGGDGGDYGITAGNGGSVTGAQNGGDGGSIPLTPGAAGTSSGASAGNPGAVKINGPLKSPVPTVQNLSTGNTIALPTGGFIKRLSASGGAVTGIILPVGRHDGEVLILFNIESSNSVTFAASGTSHVADGTSAVIAALRSMVLCYDATSSLWYRTG